MTQPGIEPRSPGPLANTLPQWTSTKLTISSNHYYHYYTPLKVFRDSINVPPNWRKACLRWVRRRAVAKIGWAFPKMPWHSPKNERLRRQALNLVLSKRVKAWGSGNVSLGRVTRILRLPVTHARQPQLTTVCRDVTHPTRSETLIPRPAEMCPIFWIQLFESTASTNGLTLESLVTASFLKSPRLFSVFWLISIMQFE